MVRGFKGDGLGPQAGVGIAQATLYVIVVPAVYFGFVKPRGARQHIPCLALFIFSALRLVAVILNLTLALRPHSEPLRIPAVILFNIGLPLLLIATAGSIRIINAFAFGGRRPIFGIAITILFLAGLSFSLLVIGNALESNSQVAMAGLNVARAGYAAIALALAMAIATLLHLMRYRLQVPESDRVPLYFTLISTMFLIPRTTYGFLFEFAGDPWNSKWNPILGDALPYGLMGMAAEFLALFFQLLPFATTLEHYHLKTRSKSGC